MNSSCEKCGIVPEIKYSSGRFCSQFCARSFSTAARRKEINEKVSKTLSAKSSWIKGKTLEKKFDCTCKICGLTFKAVRRTKKYCDAHPGGHAVALKSYFQPVQRTDEQESIFQMLSARAKSVWTVERRAEQSARMKKIAKDKPLSYTGSNRGRVKEYIVDGNRLQGTWEVDFYIWARDSGFAPERPKLGFPYDWKGCRTYYPDFYIPSLDLYVEVKGFETEQDLAKWAAFPAKLIVLKNREITLLRKGINVLAPFQNEHVNSLPVKV